MSDPGKYRTKEELAGWKERDPLHRAQRELAAEHGLSEAQLEAIDDAVSDEMDRAVQFADASPAPDPEHRFKHHMAGED